MVERLAEDQGYGVVGGQPGGRGDGRRNGVHLSQGRYPDGAASVRDGHRHVHVPGHMECLDCRGAIQCGVVIRSIDRDGTGGVGQVDHHDTVGRGDHRVGAAVHREGVHRRSVPEGGMHAVGDLGHRDWVGRICGVGYLHRLEAVVVGGGRRRGVPEGGMHAIGYPSHRCGVGGVGYLHHLEAVI